MEELRKQMQKALAQKDFIKRRLQIVTILTEALHKKNIVPVIVGGFAVELWTMGSYATMDVDIIAEGIADEGDVLTQLGLKNSGGVWTLPDSDIIIEFPKPPLDGDYQKLQPIETDRGQVYVLGIEDILLDRTSAAKFWRDQSSMEWAIYLAAAHFHRIDWKYCHETAQSKGIEDTLNHVKNEAMEIIKQ